MLLGMSRITGIVRVNVKKKHPKYLDNSFFRAIFGNIK